MRAGCDVTLFLELSRLTVVLKGVGNTCFGIDTSDDDGDGDDDDDDGGGNGGLSLPCCSCSSMCSKEGRSSCLHLTTDNV